LGLRRLSRYRTSPSFYSFSPSRRVSTRTLRSTRRLIPPPTCRKDPFTNSPVNQLDSERAFIDDKTPKLMGWTGRQVVRFSPTR
jgi:hypothetical protein